MQDMYLKDGRNFLYVGDVGRKLVINIPNLNITKVNYETKEGFTKDVEVEYSDEGLLADIPNSFLSGAYSALTCYAIAFDGEYEYTASEAHFEIKERQKSEGYSPTEQQLITWDYIERKAVEYMQQTGIYMNRAGEMAAHSEDAADAAIRSKNASAQSEANAKAALDKIEKLINGMPEGWQEMIQRVISLESCRFVLENNNFILRVTKEIA